MQIPVPVVRAAAIARLEAEGVLPATAAAAVDPMVRADLWGRATHGLSVRYAACLERARQGAGRRAPEVVVDRGVTVTGTPGCSATSSTAPASSPWGLRTVDRW